MRRMLAAAALLLSATAAQAQIYRFRNYDSNAGLPSNAVYAIFQDSKGYIWFATDGGASRYDGLRYVNFSSAQGLVDASTRGFVEDRQGRLWILTKGGVSRYDGSRFQSFTTEQGLVHNETRCGLRASDGALWFGTTHGLSRYDGARFQNFGAAQGLPDAAVWTLLQDRSGVVWAGLRGGGLARFDGARFTVFGPKDGLPSDKVFGMTEDPAGGLWLATTGGLAHFDGRRFRCYSTADGLPNINVSSVLVDRHGRVWCGTFGGGVARLEDGRFTVFNRKSGLPDDYVTALYKDAEENVWMAGLWVGAFRFVSEHFANYTSAMGLGEGLVTGIAEARDGSLWLSSVNDGLSRLDAGVVRRFGAKDGLADARIWALLIDSRGRVWTGGLSGVSYYDGSRFRSFGLQEIGARDRINAIAEDGQGRIWLGSGASTSTGVFAWDGHGFTRYGTEHGLAHVQVNTFAIDHSGGVWICTEDGLSHFDGQRFTTYRQRDGLPGKRVLVAYEDERGALWVGTAGGLARFDGRSFRTFTTRDGLVNDFVHTLTSVDGVLWVGTARGISAWDGVRFRNYTVEDGIISHEITTGASLRRRNGSIWFGTAEGAVRYQIVKETVLPRPPRVYVTAVHVREETLAPGPTLSLPHDRNSVTFEFLGLSFAGEGAVRYSYLLEGLDREWSAPVESRLVRFANLDPGRYRFLVKARSAAELWSDPAAVAVEVRPAFWGTWWFRLLALAALAGLANAAYHGRVQALERGHRRRVEALRRLLESIRVINSGLGLAAVLESIAQEGARLVDGLPGGIGLVRENRVLFERGWVDGRWLDSDASFDLGQGVAGRVAVTGQPLIANDLEDSRLVDAEKLRGLGAVGLIDVPIIDRAGRVVGVLDVLRPPGRAPFGEAERQLLESLAPQAAVAIENAALYGALEEKKIQVTESLWAIEELYKNEQQMTRMLEELNRMKTNFMIVTSHEMRTPLTLLKGYHEALLDGHLGSLTPSQGQCLALGHRAVDRMIASFADILEMLQIDERRAILNREPTDCASIVERALSELQPFVEKRRQLVVVDAPGPLPQVMVDAEKIRLVLLNLVENAIKFTPDGGEIRVRLRAEPVAVHVAVEDTGIGIEAWELERVFDKFYAGPDSLHHSSGTYQFKARGAGLGLAIAKGHVEAHGGRIWAASPGAGQGSTFHVLLPLAGSAGAKVEEVAAAGN